MQIVNLTPHALNLRNAEGEMVEIPPSGTVARVSETTASLPVVAGFNVVTKTYGDVENLPDSAPDTIYVVSALVLQRVTGRDDVYAPGTAIRDEAGKIIGADGLSAAAPIPVHTVQVGNEHDGADVVAAFARYGIPARILDTGYWPPTLLVGDAPEGSIVREKGRERFIGVER